MKKLLLLLLLVLSFNAQADGCIFSDDFEAYSDGTMPTGGGTGAVHWFADGSRIRPVVVSGTQSGLGPYAGTHYIKGIFDGTYLPDNGDGMFTTMRLTTSNYAHKLFFRVFVRQFGVTTGFKFLRHFVTSPAYVDHYQSTGNAPGSSTLGFKDECPYTGSGCDSQTYWGDGDQPPSYTHVGTDSTWVNSVWHKIEWYYDNTGGSSNSVMKVWHDGLLIANRTTLTFPTTWDDFYLMSNGDANANPTNLMYFDNFEVYSDNGTGGTGSMSSATITGCFSSSSTIYVPWKH